MPLARLTPDQTVLLVVDMQEKLAPLIHDHERVTDQAARVIRGFRALDLPILVTQQYPQGLGPTIDPITQALGEKTTYTDKLKFSACVSPVRERLEELRRPTVVVCGIETHVCVLQTALDLLSMGLTVGVATDATGSRREWDRQTGLRRMESAGALSLTVEMALLELVHEAGTDRFKAILPIIR